MNLKNISVGDAVKKLNPHLFRGLDSETKALLKAAPIVKHKRIHQNSKPLLNKLEQEFFDTHLDKTVNTLVIKQGIRFRLANGLWYKPDFVCIALGDPLVPIRGYEVKGPHAFRGGFENLKMAAALYFVIKWHLVWKENGQWHSQTVLP